jgi:hypothetical protein
LVNPHSLPPIASKQLVGSLPGFFVESVWYVLERLGIIIDLEVLLAPILYQLHSQIAVVFGFT